MPASSSSWRTRALDRMQVFGQGGSASPADSSLSRATKRVIASSDGQRRPPMSAVSRRTPRTPWVAQRTTGEQFKIN